MAFQHAYMTTSKLAGLADAAITVSAGTTTNRGRLVDSRVDKTFAPGSVASGWNIKFDLGSAQAITAFAILNHNLATFSAVCKIEGADDSAISANVVTFKSDTTLRANDAILQGESVSRRWWRLTFTWSASQSPTIGEIYAGVSSVISRFTTFGNERGRVHKTVLNESDYGMLFGNFLSGPIRTRTLIWEDLSETEKDEIVAMHSAVKGNAFPLVWAEIYEASSSAADSAHQETIFGHFTESNLDAKESDYNLYGQISLTVLEQTKGVGL